MAGVCSAQVQAQNEHTYFCRPPAALIVSTTRLAGMTGGEHTSSVADGPMDNPDAYKRIPFSRNFHRAVPEYDTGHHENRTTAKSTYTRSV